MPGVFPLIFFSSFHNRIFTMAEPGQGHVTELLNC